MWFECFVQLGEGLHDAEAMERNALKQGKNFVRTKGEGSVKSNAKELGSGVECKGGCLYQRFAASTW